MSFKAQSTLSFLMMLPLSLVFFSSLVFGQSNIDLRNLIFESSVLQEPNPDSLNLMNIEIGKEGLESKRSLNNARLREYEQAVLAIEENEGVYSTSLSEKYLDLGNLYQEVGNHILALAAFENSQHSMRLSSGLFTLEQIPVLESMLRSYSATNNFKKMDDSHAHLLYLHKKNYSLDDSEMIAANRAWADWNILHFLNDPSTSFGVPAQTFNEFVRSPAGSDVMAVSYPNTNTGIRSTAYIPASGSQEASTSAALADYALSTNRNALNFQILRDPRLIEARKIYETELKNQNRDVINTSFSDNNFELQKKLANIAYINKRQMSYFENSANRSGLNYNHVFLRSDSLTIINKSYVQVKNKLEKFIEALQQEQELDYELIAQVKITLADWHLSFDRPNRARKAYMDVYSILKEFAQDDSLIDLTLSPKVAQIIPAFVTHQYSRGSQGINAEEEIIYKGYIDVEFTQDKSGNIQDLKILNVSTGTSVKILSLLNDHLRGQKFRPVFKAGEVIEQKNIQLKYYYTY